MVADGYDLPQLGLDDGHFYAIHILALVCMCTGFISANAVVVISFKHHKTKKFFSWSKSERLVIYSAVCDAGFNVTHSAEHLQMLITMDHARPPELCRFYGFFLIELGFAQVFLVLFVAVNIFFLMFLEKNVDFGKRDWKLLVPVVTLPFLIGVGSLAADQVGPSGAFCFFDSVKARVSNVYLTTIPMCMILVTNGVLYGLTWYKIESQSKRLAKSLGVTRRGQRAATNMFLFLIAFFVQWWAVAVYGVWLIFDKAPMALFLITVFFSNMGGVWNGIVYIIIRRRRKILYPQQSTIIGGKSTVYPTVF